MEFSLFNGKHTTNDSAGSFYFRNDPLRKGTDGVISLTETETIYLIGKLIPGQRRKTNNVPGHC